MNIQRTQIDPDMIDGFIGSEEHRCLENNKPRCDEAVLPQIIALLENAQRPVILAGGGIRTARATEQFRAFVDKTGIPVVCSLMGLDVLPGDHHCNFGLIGSYGNRYGNLTLANCDLLFVLGSRLDSRQTGTRPDTFARAAKKIHVDIDRNELSAKISVDMAIHCDVTDFLTTLNCRLGDYQKPNLDPWYAIIERYRAKYPTRSCETGSASIDPNLFLERLSKHCGHGDIICLDVGQNQMWASQSFRLKEGQRMLISGGMGAMGFALPAALGSAKAAPERRVVVICGDGGIQVNIQDLETIVRHHLPVKIIVFNNSCLGMVRQFQDMYFGGRRQSTVIGYGCPDLVKIAATYGLTATSIRNLNDADAAMDQFLTTEGPAFLEVKLDQSTCVNPKLIVNHPIEDMSPHLDIEELRSEMLVELVDEQ